MGTETEHRIINIDIDERGKFYEFRIVGNRYRIKMYADGGVYIYDDEAPLNEDGSAPEPPEYGWDLFYAFASCADDITKRYGDLPR